MARLWPGATLVAMVGAALLLAGVPASPVRADDGDMLGQAEGAIKDLSKLFDSLSRALPEGKTIAVSTLARVINEAHAKAEPIARPMPADLRKLLAPYFPETPWVLEKTRWVVAEEVGGLPDLIMLNPDVGAMTVGDIVIFRSKRDAETNAPLWAHELVHVLQFQALGVDAFAREYLETGGVDLENEAEEFSDRVRRRIEGNKPVQSRSDAEALTIG